MGLNKKENKIVKGVYKLTVVLASTVISYKVLNNVIPIQNTNYSK